MKPILKLIALALILYMAISMQVDMRQRHKRMAEAQSNYDESLRLYEQSKLILSNTTWAITNLSTEKPYTNTPRLQDEAVVWATVTNTEILAVSNRPWIQFESSCVLRCTDAEWTLLTNAYASKLTTNTITFYK